MECRDARSRTPWCAPRASDMLEMSEREIPAASTQSPGAELRRRSLETFSRSRFSAAAVVGRSQEVSQHATVGCPQKVSQYSAEVDASQARQGGLSRRRVLPEFRCARGDACAAMRETERRSESVATQWSWRICREQLSHRGEHHTVMLEAPVCRAVAEHSKRKTNPFVQTTWTDIFQPK